MLLDDNDGPNSIGKGKPHPQASPRTPASQPCSPLHGSVRSTLSPPDVSSSPPLILPTRLSACTAASRRVTDLSDDYLFLCSGEGSPPSLRSVEVADGRPRAFLDGSGNRVPDKDHAAVEFINGSRDVCSQLIFPLFCRKFIFPRRR